MTATGRIVGFDPGLHLTGYGVLAIGPSRPTIVEAGVFARRRR